MHTYSGLSIRKVGGVMGVRGVCVCVHDCVRACVEFKKKIETAVSECSKFSYPSRIKTQNSVTDENRAF